MPAIRFLDSQRGVIVKHTTTARSVSVPIRLKDGKVKRYTWLGFICKAGTRDFPEGAYCKMEAWEVSAQNGDYDNEWIKLARDQSVACWRILYETTGQLEWGIYGIVDESGLPIVIQDPNRPVPPTPEGKLIFLNKGKKKPAAAVENQRA